MRPARKIAWLATGEKMAGLAMGFRAAWKMAWLATGEKMAGPAMGMNMAWPAMGLLVALGRVAILRVVLLKESR